MATMTMPQFWEHMKEKAAMHIAAVSEKPDPETESDVKEHLACVLKHGSSNDVAETIVEAVEWQVAHMMECMHESVGPVIVGAPLK